MFYHKRSSTVLLKHIDPIEFGGKVSHAHSSTSSSIIFREITLNMNNNKKSYYTMHGAVTTLYMDGDLCNDIHKL